MMTAAAVQFSEHGRETLVTVGCTEITSRYNTQDGTVDIGTNN